MKNAVLTMMVVLPMVAFGATININLMNSTLTGGSGVVLTFSGSLANTTGIVQNLNGAQISGLLPSFNGNVTPFFINAPLFLTANQTTSNFGLFSVAIPSGIALGPYSGTFSILGGPNINDQALIGSTGFTVQVLAPEPETWGLMLTAAFALAARRALRAVT